MDSNHRRHCQQIYSLPRLAASVPHQDKNYSTSAKIRHGRICLWHDIYNPENALSNIYVISVAIQTAKALLAACSVPMRCALGMMKERPD